MTKLALFFGCLILLGCKVDSQPETSPVDLPEQGAYLEELPKGILVNHDPETVYVVADTTIGPDYYWIHKTTVSTLDQPLKITEFGGCYREKGRLKRNTTIYNSTAFGATEFGQWYKCENANLVPGESYSDGRNYLMVKADMFSPDGSIRKYYWYYIGENEAGERFVGIGEVHYVSQLR